MAQCEFCEQEMLGAGRRGCRADFIIIGAMKYPRIRYGEETHNQGSLDQHACCPDCGVQLGRYHHDNCDDAQCPACGEQESFCDCQLEHDVTFLVRT